MTDVMRAGTPEAETALTSLQAELEAITAEVERIEHRLPSLDGAERAGARQQLAQLEYRKACCEQSKRRLTFDENKRLKGGVSCDEVCAALDRVNFLHNARGFRMEFPQTTIPTSSTRSRSRFLG